MKITWKGFKRAIAKAARMRPLLRLFGIKDKTVVGKIGEGAEKVDDIINKP